MLRFISILYAVTVTISFLTLNSVASAQALGGDDPCPTPEIQNSAAAIITPDKYAWELFVELNHPAVVETKCPDNDKSFGANGPVVWETWRNVRTGSEDAIFLSNAKNPGPWRVQSDPNVRTVADFVSVPLKQAVLLTATDLLRSEGSSVFADAAVGQGNEVRMNRDGYIFVRDNELYNADKQNELAASGQKNIVFPASSKEIKAQWRRIRDQDKDRYHWTIFKKEDGTREIWGLTALHFTTKDIPNWFWATFEHMDNETEGPTVFGGRPNEGWKEASVDKFACDKEPFDCNLLPTGLGLEGTKWENYRLRGTQVDFVDTIGRDTILANSQIERGFQGRSSCITCHALASRHTDRDAVPNVIPFSTDTGAPITGRFLDRTTGKQSFMQLDFVFSLYRAQRP